MDEPFTASVVWPFPPPRNFSGAGFIGYIAGEKKKLFFPWRRPAAAAVCIARVLRLRTLVIELRPFFVPDEHGRI